VKCSSVFYVLFYDSFYGIDQHSRKVFSISIDKNAQYRDVTVRPPLWNSESQGFFHQNSDESFYGKNGEQSFGDDRHKIWESSDADPQKGPLASVVDKEDKAQGLMLMFASLSD